jgi:hypothetical protein
MSWHPFTPRKMRAMKNIMAETSSLINLYASSKEEAYIHGVRRYLDTITVVKMKALIAEYEDSILTVDRSAEMWLLAVGLYMKLDIQERVMFEFRRIKYNRSYYKIVEDYATTTSPGKRQLSLSAIQKELLGDKDFKPLNSAKHMNKLIDLVAQEKKQQTEAAIINSYEEIIEEQPVTKDLVL